MSDDLPKSFDLIVMGTGFVESCIAAAASRVGKTVLHLDANDYYGDVWSSFSLDALNTVLDAGKQTTLRNASYTWHDMEATGEASAAEPNISVWTRDAVLAKSRRFSLDLSPRILYAAGELVQLLIKSNICRYAEFRALDHVCMRYNEEIVSVPCSRSDVFNSKALSIVEKRLLMKFLTICNDYGEDKCNEDALAFRGKTFLEYIQSQRVTEKIVSCVMQAIAMCTAETGFEEGMQRTKRFLSSLGRYGNTPFLFPMYGCGELPQCFCRLCAVYGGIYCLKRNVDDVSIASDTQQVQVNTLDHMVSAKHMVCGAGCVPTKLANFGELQPHISRGIYISASPLGSEELNKGGGGVNLLRLTAAEGKREAIFIQLSHYSGACPEGLFVFHLTTTAVSEDPAADLAAFTAQLFHDSQPQIIYSAHFTIAARTAAADSSINSFPIYCTDAPSYELDYDAAIANARHIFSQLYGQEEFLPRAPDPEEIVIEGEDPCALQEHNLPEDLRAQLHDLVSASNQMEIND